MRANRFVNHRVVLVLVLAAALAGPTPARAGFILVTDPNSLGANDSASWSGFTVNNPTVVSTNGTNVGAGNVTGTLSLGTLLGSPALEVNGANAFNGGAYTSSASMTLTFNHPVFAVGSQMTALSTLGGSLEIFGNFTITAFDSNGNSQTFSDFLNGTEFVGITSNTN